MADTTSSIPTKNSPLEGCQMKSDGVDYLPSDWVETTLGEVVETVIDNRGKNPSYYTEKGIPVIDNVLIKENRRIDLKEARRFIDDNLYNNFIRKHGESSDVIITLVGNGYGNIALFPNEKSVIIQNTVGLRVNKKSDNLFLYYLLKKDKKKILDLNIGAAQPSVKVGDLLNIKFLLPPLPEQKAIASILSAFDDKIELLREQNKTLEEMGQTIFKEWFGKYGVDDELPEGWKVGKLGEELVIKQGKYLEAENLSEAPTEEKKYPIYGGSGIRGYIEDFMYEKPMVFLTCRGNGCGLIQFSKEQSSITNSCMAFENIDSPLSSEFIYFLSKKIDFESVTSGSAQPQITVTNLYNLEIIIPDQETLKQFDEEIKPIFIKIRDNSEQIQSLARSRNELLPKLMSGAVRVEF